MSFRRVERKGGYHTYELNGKRLPGVTTLIGDGVPKPALVGWSARVAAEYAADHVDEIARLERDAAVDLIKGAANRSRNQRGNIGSQVHDLARRLDAGEQVEIPDELAGYVDAYLAFVSDWQPVTIAAERPIVNRRWRYAGTFDLICRLGELTTLVDFKTGASGVFPETCLQVAAYRHAETMLDAGGTEVRMPHTDAGHALWLLDDGRYELSPVESGDDVFHVFLHACHVAGFQQRAKDELIGLPLAIPTPAVAS